MLLLYMLIRESPTETCDPETKQRYGLSVILHVFGGVITHVLELIMATIAIDVVAGSLLPTDLHDCLAEYLVGGIVMIVPGICLLITMLIWSGLLVER